MCIPFGYFSWNFFEIYSPIVSPAANVVAMTMRYVDILPVCPFVMSGKKFILMISEAMNIIMTRSTSRRPMITVPAIFRAIGILLVWMSEDF